MGTGKGTGRDESAVIEWARGSDDRIGAVWPASRRGGSGGGGDESRGGSIGASGACLTLGDVSPTEDSRLRRGGKGGGSGERGRVGAG